MGLGLDSGTVEHDGALCVGFLAVLEAQPQKRPEVPEVPDKEHDDIHAHGGEGVVASDKRVQDKLASKD